MPQFAGSRASSGMFRGAVGGFMPKGMIDPAMSMRDNSSVI
jgi:hypothetical protein